MHFPLVRPTLGAMVSGLLLSFVIGWVIGGLSNWLADQLPHLPQRSLHFDRAQFVNSLSLPWLWDKRFAAAQVAHPWRRSLLTMGMAAAFTVGWLRFGDDWGRLLVGWFYTAWLLVVLVIDLEHRRVLNLMLPPAVLVALIASLLATLNLADLPAFTSMLLGGGAGFVAFLVVFILGRGRMMGAGDVKLAGVIGLMVGYPLVWIALALGIVLGGLAAIFLIVRCRAAAKSYMAYGPYLALGALMVLWAYWP
ncbi:MAG: prepilin peptidase [Caldilineaceae bacterium]|nr:prepilin peptidase [Caldilineaceae bacterium]